MLYSIQNSFGEVYGIFPMPDCGMTANDWAAQLSTELKDIASSRNGVRITPLAVSDGSGGYEMVDRVVIDIEPVYATEEARIARVHETIGRLAAEHSFESP